MRILLDAPGFSMWEATQSISYNTFKTEFRLEFDADKKNWLSKLSEPGGVHNFRTLCFSSHLIDRLQFSFSKVSEYGDEQARTSESRGFLTAFVEHLDTAIGEIGHVVLKEAPNQIATIEFAPGEALFKWRDPFGTEVVRPADRRKGHDIPRPNGLNPDHWPLIKCMTSLTFGSTSDEYYPRLLRLPELDASKSATLALADLLGCSAAQNLTVTQVQTHGPDVFFRLSETGNAADIANRFSSLLDIIHPMPSILCLPELSAGDSVFAMMKSILESRILQNREIPYLTLIGRTHLPSGGDFRNEAWAFLRRDGVCQDLNRVGQKRNRYDFSQQQSTWIEFIGYDKEFLCLDVPGFGRIAVVICRDFVLIDPKLLAGLGVNFVFVPAMTSFTSMADDFLTKARELVRWRIASACVNSGFRWNSDVALSCCFVSPILPQSRIKQSQDIAQNVAFCEGDVVCGATFSLLPPFRKIAEFRGDPITFRNP